MVVCYHVVLAFYGAILHYGLWRRTEHLFHCEVERTYAVSLLKSKAMVAGGLTNGVHRSTLTVGNLLHMLYGTLINEQSHTLL